MFGGRSVGILGQTAAWYFLYLSILHWNRFTGGDEGFVVPTVRRVAGVALDLGSGDVRFALALYSVCLGIAWALVRGDTGRVWLAPRGLLGTLQHRYRWRWLP